MKYAKQYVLTILGILLAGVGLYLVKTLTDPQGILKPLPYLLIGIGCGLFGHGSGRSDLEENNGKQSRACQTGRN